MSIIQLMGAVLQMLTVMSWPQESILRTSREIARSLIIIRAALSRSRRACSHGGPIRRDSPSTALVSRTLSN
jgi:hypothetical protein